MACIFDACFADVDNSDLIVAYDAWRNCLCGSEPGTLILYSQIRVHVDFNSFNN
jgi:hypothetical protein